MSVPGSWRLLLFQNSLHTGFSLFLASMHSSLYQACLIFLICFFLGAKCFANLFITSSHLSNCSFIWCLWMVLPVGAEFLSHSTCLIHSSFICTAAKVLPDFFVLPQCVPVRYVLIHVLLFVFLLFVLPMIVLTILAALQGMRNYVLIIA